MSRSGWMALAAALAITAACTARADGPPEITIDRTPCAHCGMLISEPMFAAAYRVEGSDARTFDDIGCLLNAVRREPRSDAIRFWFHDGETSTWIDGAAAVFVHAQALRTPMSGGVLAYRDAAAAARAAAAHKGRVIGTLDALLASGREGGAQ